jgi:hypothetical protein
MLAGVLLHVIEATGPIDRPDDMLTHGRLSARRQDVLIEDVGDAAVFFIEDVDHPRLAGALALNGRRKSPDIEWLAA